MVNKRRIILPKVNKLFNYTYAYYKFGRYTKESFDYVHNVPVTADYSGNKVTGVTPNSLNAAVDLETKYGIYFNAVLNYISRTPSTMPAPIISMPILCWHPKSDSVSG
ncbi:MAG TPA: hypothetical protein VFC34_14330 [Puia sp.]|nr:hypothetical protein [Puia sp.]